MKFFTKRLLADIVNGFIVEHKGNISVFQQTVSGEDGVIGFDDSSGNLRRGIDTEVELRLLAIVN